MRKAIQQFLKISTTILLIGGFFLSGTTSALADDVIVTQNVTGTNNAPTITLSGSSSMSLTVGSTYTEPGYTATDIEDGNLTSSVVITGSVNTSVVGTYTLTYSVTDSGSLTTTTTRVVTVSAAVAAVSGGAVLPSLRILNLSKEVTGNSAVISWDTTSPATTEFLWGTTVDYGSGSVANASFTIHHEITLNNLTTGTQYFFLIQNTAVGGTFQQAGSFLTVGPQAPTVPPNVSHVVATPDVAKGTINLSWQNPQSILFSYVRIVRSSVFFPATPMDGDVVYEGTQEEFIDKNVVVGKEYYYSIFSASADHEYSSGVITSSKISLPQKPGEPTTPIVIPSSGDILDSIPEATNVDPLIKKLTLVDFVFTQNGQKLSSDGKTIYLDAGKPFTVSLGYNKVPEILKTIAVTLTHPGGGDFTFLLRINQNKTAYEADLSGLSDAGNYSMNVVILDYDNQALKKISGQVAAVSFSINPSPEAGALASLVFLLSLLLLAASGLLKIVLGIKRKLLIASGQHGDTSV